MKPQDHSDTTLLVWSDWLEENGEEQKAHELREEIANPPADRWSSDNRRSGVVGVDGRIGGDYVGGGGRSGVVISINVLVDCVGGGFSGARVGGSYDVAFSGGAGVGNLHVHGDHVGGGPRYG